MKTPLVLHNLLHQPVRTLVAILGVAFAILLVFMQLGFYGSGEMMATTLYDALDFDLVLVSSNYFNSTRPGSFPLLRIVQTLDHPDIAAAEPLYIEWMNWRIKDNTKPSPFDRMLHSVLGGDQDATKDGLRRAILALACNLDKPVLRCNREVFPNDSPEQAVKALRTPNTVLMDTGTRNYFKERGPGTVTEMNRTEIRVVGEFFINPGYGADGMVLMSDDTYGRLTATRTLDRPALGLIKLKPGSSKSPAEVAKELRRTILQARPPNERRSLSHGEHAGARDEVEVFTRQEIRAQERDYWLYRTNVGIIFFVGVVVALFVGVIFVYQVIATDISDHVAEYATLRAIGYGPGYLSRVVLKQALVLAVLGYLPALGVAFVLYAWGRNAANLLLSMTLGRAAFVLVLSVAMCSVSGLMALRKVKKADPAEMF